MMPRSKKLVIGSVLLFLGAVAPILRVQGEEAPPPAPQVVMESTLREFSLDIRGVKDFAAISRLKRSLQGKLPESATFFEKQLARGQVIFAIRAPFSDEELQQVLAQVSADTSDFIVTGREGNLISARVK